MHNRAVQSMLMPACTPGSERTDGLTERTNPEFLKLVRWK